MFLGVNLMWTPQINIQGCEVVFEMLHSSRGALIIATTPDANVLPQGTRVQVFVIFS